MAYIKVVLMSNAIPLPCQNHAHLVINLRTAGVKIMGVTKVLSKLKLKI